MTPPLRAALRLLGREGTQLQVSPEGSWLPEAAPLASGCQQGPSRA